MTAADSFEDGATAPTDAQPSPSIFSLLSQALFINGAAYAAIRNHRSPFRRGFLALLAILGIVALARLIGLGWVCWLHRSLAQSSKSSTLS